MLRTARRHEFNHDLGCAIDTCMMLLLAMFTPIYEIWNITLNVHLVYTPCSPRVVVDFLRYRLEKCRVKGEVC